MKRIGATLFQLDVVSTDTMLQVVKQAIGPNTQFFDSLSLQPLSSIDELFQRGNKYTMLEDDILATTVGAKEREADAIETTTTNVTAVPQYALQGTKGLLAWRTDPWRIRNQTTTVSI